MSDTQDKNETSRFLGEGVSFKAKLIGILEVSEARGDRMCQEALSDLKMAIRAAGEHKQRITINIAIDGLRLRDEKTGDLLYHHPVHKISFIAQDMTDSRAFGYIFGSPDKGHGFFGIKTDKAASQVVIAMRDLFQVVFALKKKEIELAKQHLDKTRYGTSTIFSDTAISNAKVTQDTASKTTTETKSGLLTVDSKAEGPAVADLVDLELELNSLQQGINQMERITPSDPFGSKDDPFGDSFTSYTPKPILPPPPSGRERSSRTSESSSLFSPKTPHTTRSTDVSSTVEADDSTSTDWFASSTIEKPLDDSLLMPELSVEQQQHEITKQEILSQFDVFTELDPLGRRTGKIKPYVDKKDFFQELKNPPKKVLNDLVSEKQPQESKLFTATFDQKVSTTPKASTVTKNESFSVDPFGEDPFDKADPFSEADPFDTESFGVEFKVFNKDAKTSEVAERFKFPPLEKSPNKNLAKQLRKHNTFDVKFDDKVTKLSHDNRSLDMSSESECAPDPPPRPASNLIQIKPPPLPPKKQPGDLCSKPPPRPPYSEDSHYDYIENYETGPNSIEIKKLDKSPPIPAPARKNKFESDFMSPPQRPKKQFSAQQGWSSEEDYLTPISFSKPQGKEYKSVRQSSSSVLLPPPQRNPKEKSRISPSRVETKSPVPVPVPVPTEKKLNTVEGLDITLSQLTLSGLNEIASKLDIPASRLSNMTLVQLTEYISNYIKDKSDSNMKDAEFTDFNADFANFNNFNEEPHDKYAVFRELLQEEIKQTKIDTEPVEHILERKKEEEEIEEKISNLDVNSINGNDNVTDRYAALRDIVENEIKQKEEGEEDIEANIINDEVKLNQDEKNILNEITNEELNNESNIINTEQKILASKEIILPNNEVIEYSCIEKRLSPVPLKSPVGKIKSPVPGVVTEVLQNNNRLNSGSISDVISGSSPEVDNTGSNSEVIKKTEELTGESWAIFDQPNLTRQITRDKQSEDAASPWSSDSKEFFNGSPPDWSQRPGSNKWKRGKKDQEGWWDTSAEPEAQYCPTNRRSTDSYDEECYDYYDKPSRRRRPMTWSNRAGMGKEGEKGAAGQSSSSRDASPWEEEPRRKEIREARDLREHRESWASRHSKGQHSLEKQRERRPADSWDEEDDYEYDEEHSGRYHWNERRSSSRESDKERHGLRERECDRWPDDWVDNRRHRRRRKVDRDRWCCPNWEFDPAEPPGSRYRWQDRKPVIEDHYYSRDSQESPWEDEYEKEPEKCHSSHYLSSVSKRPNWKRPSSASEMDRKTGETRTRPAHYHTGSTGGSDSERDRRYKGTRRSRSRDSQFTESVSSHSRHKIDPNLTLRGPHRSKLHIHQKLLRDGEFVHDLPPKKLEPSKVEITNKRSTILTNRKKPSPKAEDSSSSKKLLFENNFMPSESESPMSVGVSPKFTFENDFETSEAESPIVSKSIKGLRFDIEPKRSKSSVHYESRKIKEEKISPSSRTTQRSPFEDDFSPPHEKSETPVHENVSSIKEEGDEEEEDLFTTNNLDKSVIRRKKLNKNRFSNNFYVDHANLKKSESVNIFARESDPFDDEFFSEQSNDAPPWAMAMIGPKGSEHKWTEDFGDFSFAEEK